MVEGDGEQHEHHDQPETPARGERHIRDVLRDQDAEGVDAGTSPADPVRHPDNPHRNDRIHAHGETHRYDDWHEWHVLLTHADRERAEAEQRKTAADQQPGALAQAFDRAQQRRIDRAGLAQHGNDAADQEDQEDNCLCRLEAASDRHEEVPRRQGDTVLGRQRFIGASDDDHAVGLIRHRCALELSVRNRIGQQLRDDDEGKDQYE